MYAPTPVATGGGGGGSGSTTTTTSKASLWTSLLPCYGSESATTAPPPPPPVRVVQHDGRPISVAELSTHLEVGDLLFMCGNTLMAWLIEKFGRTRFSHVCMVDTVDVVDSYSGALERREHYLWESVYHADQCRCILQRRTTNGVRLTQYEDRMMALFNEFAANVSAVCVAVVKLEYCGTTPDTDPAYPYQWRQELAQRLHDYQIANSGRPYQVDVTALLQSRYRWLFGRAPREDASVFCTELVMLTYKAMGLVADNVDANVSLTALSYDCHRLPMLHGFRLRPQIDYYLVARPPHIAHAYYCHQQVPPSIPPPLSSLAPLIPSTTVAAAALPLYHQQQQQQQQQQDILDGDDSEQPQPPPPLPITALASAISAAIAAAQQQQALPSSSSSSSSLAAAAAATNTTNTLVHVKRKLHLT